MDQKQILEATETRLGEWEISSLTESEKLAWAKTSLPKRMIEILKSGDHPLQLVVHESLFDAATEAMQNPVFPEDAHEGLVDSREEFEEQMIPFCQNFIVRSAKTEEMAVPLQVLNSLPVEEQFCLFITFRGEQIKYLQMFDQKLGISQYISENRVPINLTERDLQEMLRMFILLQCINKTAQNQVVAAKAGSLDSQIFKPR